MGTSILHRGPDHSEIWIDEAPRVGLAHNRLSIIDLSPAGNQPMASASGRYVIAYNGEIYDHSSIREELAEQGAAPQWRGHSDTETLLAAIDAWGVRRALERSTGMFAFALWDKAERTLILARDRLGEKPLYYGRQHPGAPFLFGSELKAVAAHPQFRRDIDRGALILLVRYNYIPAPYCIYEGMRKLPAGCFLSLREGVSEPAIEEYWSGAAVAEAGVANPLELSDEEAIERAGAAAGSGDRATDDRRRAARRLPFGRGRFVDGRCADAEAVSAAGEDLHDRLPRGRLQRGRARPGGGAASRRRITRSCT